MSIQSPSNPAALLSQVTGNNPFAVATPYGASSFISTLLQELRQSGAAAASGTAAAATTAGAAGTASTAGTSGTTTSTPLQGHGHRHHGGGMSQLISLLQQSQASGATGSAVTSSGASSLQLQALLQNLKNGSAATPGQLLSTAV